PARVTEVRITGIDVDVVPVEQRKEGGNLLVHRGAGRHHQDYGAGPLNRCRKAFERFARNNALRKRAGLLHEGARALGRAVENSHAEALLRDVERQIGAHNAKADQPDISFYHETLPCSRLRALSNVLLALASPFSAVELQPVVDDIVA